MIICTIFGLRKLVYSKFFFLIMYLYRCCYFSEIKSIGPPAWGVQILLLTKRVHSQEDHALYAISIGYWIPSLGVQYFFFLFLVTLPSNQTEKHCNDEYNQMREQKKQCSIRVQGVHPS